MKPYTSRAAKRLSGRITVPGDKSISHRALMLSSQALGTTTIHGLLEGEDVLRTAAALRHCGVSVMRSDDGVWTVKGMGIGGLHAPSDILDMGNAGTAARLLMGLLSTYPYTVHFTGDESLRKRPMQRVITPLEAIGARFQSREGGRLPIAMTGAEMPLPISYTLPVASAQVKSAVMLAGLNTPGTTTVIEKEATRDHTERMLRFFGVEVEVTSCSPLEGERQSTSVAQGDAWGVQGFDKQLIARKGPTPHDSPSAHPLPLKGGAKVTLTGQPTQTYQDRELHVPGDPSSAAFPIVAALLVPGSQVTIQNVCLNPLRTGLFDVLKTMGANLTIHNEREMGGEPIGDITVKYSALKGTDVPAHIAPSMIDEYPILAIAAACATGTTTMRGLSELRVKESDRLAAILAGLVANGVDARAEGDDLIVTGNGAAPKGSGTVTTHFDHRIAMSFFVLGLVAQNPITVDDTRAIATSFPSFMELMYTLGALND